MAKHGTFYWNELMTRDVEGAKAFYAGTLGWSFDEYPMPKGGTYWVCTVNREPVAGIFEMCEPQFEGVPPHWFSYIAVDDVDARVADAKEIGAELVREIFDVPGTGRIAILQDPTGSHIGWMTPEKNS